MVTAGSEGKIAVMVGDFQPAADRADNFQTVLFVIMMRGENFRRGNGFADVVQENAEANEGIAAGSLF